MGFPRKKDFTFTIESVCIRNVFFPSMIALHLNKKQPWGTTVSSQNSSNFTFQPVDTQNSVYSKLEKLLLAGKRVISLLTRRRQKDSSMLWGQKDTESLKLTQGNCTNKRNWIGFSLRTSLHGKFAPRSVYRRLAGLTWELWGVSDLDAVSNFLYLLGLLCLSESLCFSLLNRQMI